MNIANFNSKFQNATKIRQLKLAIFQKLRFSLQLALTAIGTEIRQIKQRASPGRPARNREEERNHSYKQRPFHKQTLSQTDRHI